MSQPASIDVTCPKCGGKFTVPFASAGTRCLCPRCGSRIKIAGPQSTHGDDDQWLHLDDELPSSSQSGRDAATTPASVSQDHATGKGDDPARDEFDIPDLPPLAPSPVVRPSGMPPLSEADLDALSGYADDEDQRAAPVKVVRESPVDDTFRVKCPVCESLSYAKISQVGKQIRCSDCYSTITVPPPPKPKVKYQPDIESAPAYTFQGGDDGGDHPKPADPFRKSAEDYLRDAEASVEEAPDDDWTVPSIGEWFVGMVGMFRDPILILHWLLLSALAVVPTWFVIQFSSSQIVIAGLFVGGAVFAAILVAHGFAIMQSIANGEERVTEWPISDFWEWVGPLMTAVSAVAVSAGPIWLAGELFFGSSLMTVAVAMLSLYLLYPFVLLSMLDEQSVFVPFSVDISKSVTRSSEHWGMLYLSSAIVFFFLFLVFMAASTMSPFAGVAVSVAATVAAVFIYFGLIGQLAFTIGYGINAPPVVNDVERNPKLPE